MGQHCHTTIPDFDKKYKIIVRCDYTDYFYKQVEWVNSNSNKSVDVKIVGPDYAIRDIYFGFEDPDDALVFKIKFQT
jgi:hypothetical protein